MADNQNCIRLGAALRMRRKELGLNQVQTCDLAGVGPVFLYELEHGKATVQLDKVLAVLEVLGMGLELKESRDVLSAPTVTGEETP
ncbi:MAG: helix-turn-helix transcriptional regulator [Planctomycetes bacterium]|nr:helix-turn-helix transcriptional regulator [Planctomycetota bacterium]